MASGNVINKIKTFIIACFLVPMCVHAATYTVQGLYAENFGRISFPATFRGSVSGDEISSAGAFRFFSFIAPSTGSYNVSLSAVKEYGADRSMSVKISNYSTVVGTVSKGTSTTMNFTAGTSYTVIFTGAISYDSVMYSFTLTIGSSTPTPTLSISPTSKSVGSGGGSGSISVSCSSSWTAMSSASWIILTSGSSGNGNGTIAYTLWENTGTLRREGTITVKCGNLTRTCTITQNGAEAIVLTIGGGKTSMSRAYSCEAKAGETFSVQCSSSWTATASASWITITSGASGSGDGTVKYSLAENTGTSKRDGKITVTSGNKSCVCTITQDKPLLIGGKTSMERTYDEAAHPGCYFSVTCSQSPWTAVSSASWVTIKSGSASGTGSGKVYYDIAANTFSSSRAATITVTSRGGARICTITQKGNKAVTLTIGGGKTSMSRTYSCEAKSGETFSVACNASWNATSSASWITITSGSSGSGNGTIKYKLSENAGTSKRGGKITVKCGSLTRTCTITQDKPLLIGGKTSMERTYDASAHPDCYFSVTCSQSPWTAVSSASWVTIKSGSASGTGSGKVYYDIAANTSSAKRTATITVTSRGLARTCTITQKGASGAAPRAMPMSRARAAAGLPAGLYEGVPADDDDVDSIRGVAYMQDGTVCEMTVGRLSDNAVFAIVGGDMYSGFVDGCGRCELTGDDGTLSVFCIESTPVGFQTPAGYAEK